MIEKSIKIAVLFSISLNCFGMNAKGHLSWENENAKIIIDKDSPLYGEHPVVFLNVSDSKIYKNKNLYVEVDGEIENKKMKVKSISPAVFDPLNK